MADVTSLNLTQTQRDLFRPGLKLTSSNSTPLTNLKFNCCRGKISNISVRCYVNMPLKPSSQVGKSLSSVIQNEPQLFYDTVTTELKRVGEDRDDVFARLKLSLGSPEASLHRRIAELKEAECHVSVIDTLYMIIAYRFSEIRVPLVPSFSKCLYNGRLEILPSKDWELESIHGSEILEMVREHLTDALGWDPGSNVSVNWSTTKVRRPHLNQVYATSLLFGYFLKSASLRLCLEHNLPPTFQNVPRHSWTSPRECNSHRTKNTIFAQVGSPSSTTLHHETNLRCYVTGLDMEIRKVCAKLKSQEAVELVEKHSGALFGNSVMQTNDKNEVILTSLSSMKRLVLEAVAFGCFLWDAEQFVDHNYKLKDN